MSDNLPSSDDISVPSPTTSSYPWDKIAPKLALSRPEVQQSQTATPWLLNVVEFGHYAAVIPHIAIIYSLIDNVECWSSYLNGNTVQLSLWFMAPFIRGVLAVVPTFLMHAYEDWQIAPTAENAKLEEENNDRLQRVAVNQMFVFLCAGDLLYYHGYFGLNHLVPFSVAVMANACLGDKNYMINEIIPSMNPKLSVGSAAGQVVGPIMKGIVFYNLASEVHHPIVQAALLSCIPFEVAGGMYEGIIAESTFSQWDHLKAISLTTMGSVLQAYAFLSLPHLLS